MKIWKNILCLYLLNMAFCALPNASCDLLDDFRFTPKEAYQKILVEKVLSGDRVVLKNGEKIKLIGLKALPVPKIKKVERDENNRFVTEEIDPWATLEERAFSFVKALCENKFVRVEFDVSKKDEDFMTSAYLFLIENNTFVNAEIIRQGYAHLQIRPPNTKYADKLREAYGEARKEKRGLQGE